MGEPITGYSRGRRVVWNVARQAWLLEDTGELAELSGGAAVVCTRCGEAPTPGGPDPCLGMIAGATGACCGHGVHLGYITWPGIGVGADWWRGAFVGQPMEVSR